MKIKRLIGALLLLGAGGCYEGTPSPPEGLRPIASAEIPIEEAQVPLIFTTSRNFARHSGMRFYGGRASFGFVIRLRKGHLDIVAGNGADKSIAFLSAYDTGEQEDPNNVALAEEYIQAIKSALSDATP